mgnify:CR=1 FL=1
MDLQKARHLVALADHGTFNKAAIAVELTQPAFSRSIRALERELGVRLVDRGAQHSRLTPYGEVVVQRARILLRGIRDAERDLEALKRGESGMLALGFAAPAAAIVLEPWLQTLAARGAGLQLRIESGDSALLLARLRDELLDVVVGEGRTLQGDPELHVEPLGSAPVVLCVRPAHPLAGVGPLTLDQVAEFPIGASAIPPALSAAFTERIGRSTMVPHGRLRISCDSFDMLRSLTRTSDLVLGTNARVVRDELRDGTLVALDVPSIAIESRTAIAWLAGRVMPSAVMQLAELARRELA